jgi:hypothetical protein
MDKWTCEMCGVDMRPDMADLRAHLKEKHPGYRLKAIAGPYEHRRIGWTNEPLTDLELENYERFAFGNQSRSGQDGDEYSDLSEDVFDLIDEVRRLRAAEKVEHEAFVQAGRRAVIAEASLAGARRAERERCVDHLLRAGSPGDSVMSDTWARAVAAELLALPYD